MQGPRRMGVKYGCNSFITLPHGSRPVSSGKGNSQIKQLCGKLAYLLSGDSCSRHVLHTPFEKQVSVSGEDYLILTDFPGLSRFLPFNPGLQISD